MKRFFIIGGITAFGITGGVHRYFTHRAYKAKLPLRVILLICYSVAGQNSILDWVRDHRVHHKFTETNADPHNAKRGFFFAHVGWLMMKKHPDVIRMGKALDCSDLFEDPLVVFHQKMLAKCPAAFAMNPTGFIRPCRYGQAVSLRNKYVQNFLFFRYFTWIKLLFCFILPTMIPPLFWGESLLATIKVVILVRYPLSLNLTWLVNSAAHLWGTKPYDKKINPAENLTVSILSGGEGYHNYHHTFPWDYRASEMGSMLNITTLWLNFFEKNRLGLRPEVPLTGTGEKSGDDARGWNALQVGTRSPL
ncbi:hypothetical protein NQ318_007923 [Aromia moschata]|uniref:Fatty acid desaturase domain-containing protein n=1 Tax=Aromia moschata TaxID=1265417 RepID=A0AAV8Y1C4_9CUCU|nr:hypothetical protein NQ318_007923 [Aromia moschata]